MVVKINCVQVGSNDYLIILAPHTPCGFQSDSVCFFGSNLAANKTLITVIGNISAELAVTLFGCHHTLIGSLLRAVDAGHIHCSVGLLIVLNIAERRIQILIQEFFIGGLIGIASIVDHFLQPVFDRPESGGCHLRISSFRGSKSSKWISSISASSLLSVSGTSFSVLHSSHNLL